MTYFPMFISLEGKPCLVVGGGRVAARKCRGLLAFGAEVTVVAERLCALEQTGTWDLGREWQEGYRLHNEKETKGTVPGVLHCIRRRFRETDLEMRDWALVVTATDERETNAGIGALCRERRIPVNVADCREECTFFFPAYCIEGSVAAGVTTSGESPGTARALRGRMEKALPQWLCEIGKEADGK